MRLHFNTGKLGGESFLGRRQLIQLGETAEAVNLVSCSDTGEEITPSQLVRPGFGEESGRVGV